MLMNVNGLVFNTKDDKSPLSVEYSFRYDQLYKCEGSLDTKLVKVDKKLRNKIKNKNCCIYYQVDWLHKPEHIYICDNERNSEDCHLKVKLILASINKYCLFLQSKKKLKI